MPDMVTLAMAKSYCDSKGGYEKTEWKTILDTQGQAVEFDTSGTISTLSTEIPYSELPVLNEISDGDTCKMVWDGVEYICPVFYDEFFGNQIGDTDETYTVFPFYVSFYKSTDEWQINIATNSTQPTHTFAVYLKTEVIVPIDPKYLPSGSGSGGGGLTVVELETVLADENTTMFSEADIAKLSAAMEAKMPVVISFELDIAGAKPRFVLMFDYFTVDGIESFYAKVQVREFMFTNAMGMWMAVVQTMA